MMSLRRRHCVIGTLCLLYACGRWPSSQPPAAGQGGVLETSGGRSWVSEASLLLGSGKCKELRALLSAVPAEQRSEEWYAVSGLGEGMCWKQSRIDADKLSAMRAFDSGSARYPESSLLIADKGALFELFGDVQTAERLYRDARQKSSDNLRRHPDSRIDRYVFERTRKRLGLRSAGAPASPSVPQPPDDLVDARPDWQREASRILSMDDCKGAIKYLEANRRSPPDPGWYTLVAQADLLCWQERLGEHYKADALHILSSGLEALPHSPRLLKSKAEYFQATHDEASASEYYERAAVQARAVLSEQPSKTAAEEAEQVLSELRLERRAAEPRQ